MQGFGRASAVLVAVAFLSGLQVALASGANDAGTGSDASDKPWSPTKIEYGTYDGAIDWESDVDWYRAHPLEKGPACVELDAVPDVPLTANLTVAHWSSDTVEQKTTAAALPTGHGFRSGLALRDIDGSRAGLVGGSTAGPYAFALRWVGIDAFAQADGGTGADAGSTFSDALPAPRPCIAGRLTDTDLRDVFSFPGDAGSQRTFSFLPLVDGLVFEIVTAAGTVLFSTDTSTVTDLILSSDETVYLVVGYEPSGGNLLTAPDLTTTTSTSSLSDYFLTFEDVDPDPSPCRPSCLS